MGDELFAKAYEAVSPRERACCKLLIARLHVCLGEERLEDDTRYLRLRQGFKLAQSRGSADWTLLLWDAACSSPSRILAALMPAILTGVPHILACQVGDSPETPAPVLAALELAGQETAACLTEQQTLNLVRKLAGRGTGRLALLGDAPWTGEVLSAARAAGIRSWSGGMPRIAVCPSACVPSGQHGEKEVVLQAPDYGMLRFAQPDAGIVPLAEPKAEEGARYDCVVCGMPRLRYWLSRTPLVLTPGHEWFWRWPELDREFFMHSRYGFAD